MVTIIGITQIKGSLGRMPRPTETAVVRVALPDAGLYQYGFKPTFGFGPRVEG